MHKEKRKRGQAITEKGQVTRRRFLDRVFMTLAGSAIVVIAGTQSAYAKVSKKSANYQGSPKMGRSCGGCARYLGNGRCAKVKGTVSARGYCNYYSRKKSSGYY